MTPIGFFRHVDLDRTNPVHTTFQAYINHLEPWESSLFEHYSATQDPDALKHHLQSLDSSPLFLAHDGGASERGSFGWVIASSTAIFWEGSGRTYGRTPGSFRTESYGMLAALQFLHHYIRYSHATVANPALEHFEYTDSESLMKRLSYSMARYHPSPGACLKSEFDLEIAILATLKLLPLTIRRKHVNSHQDDKQPVIAKLPWHVQLNIICDRLASRQLAVCPLETQVILNPHCNAYVQVRGESVTGQIRNALFDAAARPRMKEYLLRRYEWDETIFDSVNWAATHTCVRSLSSPERLFVTKLCFTLLPIGKRLQQRKAHIPADCPACDEPCEDDWHWISCPSKAEWRTKQHDLFSARLISLQTHPGLKLLILRAHKALLEYGNCDFTDAVLSADEASVIASQTAIGWRHFAFGRCSSEWSRIQEQHARAEKLDPKHFNGDLWTSKVIKHIWRSLRALWTLRNTDLHGTTYAEGEPTRRARIVPLIRRMYARAHELAPRDQAMLRMPLDERITQPLSVLVTWLSAVQPAFEEARVRNDDIDSDMEDEIAEELEIEQAIALEQAL
jgi:hypothetical protein